MAYHNNGLKMKWVTVTEKDGSQRLESRWTTRSTKKSLSKIDNNN